MFLCTFLHNLTIFLLNSVHSCSFVWNTRKNWVVFFLFSYFYWERTVPNWKKYDSTFQQRRMSSNFKIFTFGHVRNYILDSETCALYIDIRGRRPLGQHLNQSPHTKTHKRAHFQHQAGYCADPCLGYELMLLWDKRGTFLILWSVMQNMGISHNF